MSGWTPVTQSSQSSGWKPVEETTTPSPFGEGTEVHNKAEELTAKTLQAAGLPTSINNVPDWFMHLVGAAKDSKPWWNSFKKAVEEPTQENIVGAVPLIGQASVSMANDAKKGDYAGALATLVGTVAPMKAAGQVGPGLGAIKKGLQPAAESAAQRLYQSALKPPPGSYTTPEVQGMVKTGLSDQIPVSTKGIAKLNSLVKDLNDNVQAQIDAGAAQGVTVNKLSVASRLGDVGKKFATQVNPEADLTAVQKSGEEFIRNQPAEIPASEAQRLKQGTYQQLGDKAYGELSSATIESQKALARGIKEELQIPFPEIKSLNAHEGKLYDLQPALERAVRRIDNQDIISLGTKVAGGVGGALGGAPGAVAGGVMDKILGMPMVKSNLAIALHRAGVPMPIALARVAAYSAAISNPTANTAPPATPSGSATIGQLLQSKGIKIPQAAPNTPGVPFHPNERPNQ